jgi:23S rRNA (guanine745-N1)-methyltransferase
MQADKAAHLEASLAAWFALESARHLEQTVALSVAEVASLIGMGPSSHHAAPTGPEPDPATVQDVTVAFDIFGFRRRATDPR